MKQLIVRENTDAAIVILEAVRTLHVLRRVGSGHRVQHGMLQLSGANRVEIEVSRCIFDFHVKSLSMSGLRHDVDRNSPAFLTCQIECQDSLSRLHVP